MKQDWRITNQMNYLQNAALRYQSFETTPDSDHEHCSFCCEKFRLSEHDLHTGYCTLDGHHWICISCFNDFCQQFNFQIEESIDAYSQEDR